MAKRRTIVIKVQPDGDVRTEFVGFAGASCLEANRQFHAHLAELGVATKILRLTPKPELSAASTQEVAMMLEEMLEGGPSHG